jgi:hypothetical protein
LAQSSDAARHSPGYQVDSVRNPSESPILKISYAGNGCPDSVEQSDSEPEQQNGCQSQGWLQLHDDLLAVIESIPEVVGNTTANDRLITDGSDKDRVRAERPDLNRRIVDRS